MNFAPYQDVDPERERALSPPPAEVRRSKSPQLRSPPRQSTTSPPIFPHPNAFGNDDVPVGNPVGPENRGGHFDAFQTSLPLRLDYEAMLAYLLLPPAGPVLLLILEHKSDYVRYGNFISASWDLVVLINHTDSMPGNQVCSLQSSSYVV